MLRNVERWRWNHYLPEIRFRMGNMRCFSLLSPYKVDFVHNAVYQVNQVKKDLYNVSGTEEYLYHSKWSSRKSHQILLFRGHVIGVSTYYLFLVRTAERTTPFASSESVVSLIHSFVTNIGEWLCGREWHRSFAPYFSCACYVGYRSVNAFFSLWFLCLFYTVKHWSLRCN